MRAADDARCRDRPEVPPVQRVRRLPVHKEEFACSDDAAALPDGQVAADPVAVEPWVRLGEAAVERDRRRAPVAVSTVLLALAAVADRSGDAAAAVAHATAARALIGEGRDPLSTALLEHATAQALDGASRYPEAIEHEQAAVAACAAALDVAHPTCIGFRASLALHQSEAEDVGGAATQALAVQADLDRAPASALGAVGKSLIAYVNFINDSGGVNGRKINLIALDDGYSPPKAVEHTRKLVESDEVAFMFSTLGTPSNAAVTLVNGLVTSIFSETQDLVTEALYATDTHQQLMWFDQESKTWRNTGLSPVGGFARKSCRSLPAVGSVRSRAPRA